MSRYAFLDEELIGQVASVFGWGGVVRWAEQLPDNDFERLRHLAAYGWTGFLDEFLREIPRALKDHPPDEPGVAEIVTTLARAIRKNGQGRETLMITYEPEL